MLPQKIYNEFALRSHGLRPIAAEIFILYYHDDLSLEIASIQISRQGVYDTGGRTGLAGSGKA